MAYDLQEQEQLESLKAWWRQYGNAITWALIVILFVFAAWNGWHYWQRKQATEAAMLYESLQKAAATNDTETVKRAATDMRDKYGRTAYADMAGLLAARVLYESKDFAGAKVQLQSVVDHAYLDEYEQLAKLRLSGMLLESKDYAGGLKLLEGTPPDAFAALYAERQGDLLLAQGKSVEAKAAYQRAIDKTDRKDPAATQLLQLKLDLASGA